MKFVYNSKHSKINRVAKRANEIFSSAFFFKEIENYLNDFLTIENTRKIVSILQDSDTQLKIISYWNPLTHAISRNNTVLKINTAKLKKSHRSLLDLIITEYCFVLIENREIPEQFLKKDKQGVVTTIGKTARNFM